MTDEDFIAGRKQLYASGGIPALQPFEPGQIMTADDLNEPVAAIQELDRRLRAIEQA